MRQGAAAVNSFTAEDLYLRCLTFGFIRRPAVRCDIDSRSVFCQQSVRKALAGDDGRSLRMRARQQCLGGAIKQVYTDLYRGDARMPQGSSGGFGVVA